MTGLPAPVLSEKMTMGIGQGTTRPTSGIFVHTDDNAPGVGVDDALDVQGYFDSYQGTDELVDAEIVTRDPGPA